MAANDRTMWGIHAGATGDAHSLFINKGYIGLGWPNLKNLAHIPPTRDAFKQAVTSNYPQMKPGAIPVAAGQLFRFVHVAKPGDYVVYRSKSSKLIHIGQIVGEYEYKPTEEPGYPHVRRSAWQKSIEPTRATQGALYEIGSAMSFFQIKTHTEEWLAFLTGGVVETPTNSEAADDPTISIVAEAIEENTRDFVVKQFSTELKGHPFATFVAHLLNTMGYRTRISPEGADGGVDIVAHRDELGFEPPIIRVQVKSQDGNVGQPEVSALLGTLSTGDFGLFVSLSGFTSPARTFARGKGNLRLIDRDDVVNLTLAHYEQLDSRYKAIIPLKRVYVPEPLDD